VLIDNSQGLLAPALKLNIDQLDTNLEYSPSKIQANGSICFKFCYFNAEPCKWEPVLEKSGLSISCEIQEKQSLHVNIKNHEDTPEINFDLSDKFVTFFSLFSSLKIPRASNSSSPQQNLESQFQGSCSIQFSKKPYF